MLQLFADSDSDITPALGREYGFHIISMPYSIDGKTVYPYEDFEVFDAKPFYDMLRSGVIPTTSAVNTEKYKQYFEPFFAAGDDIFYVHFSAAMSATFGPMREAVAALQEKYPGRKFYTLDTKGITIHSMNIALEVADLFRAGKTPEEVLAWAEKEVDHFALYFFADDLKFFKRSGRVSGLTATMGTLLGVRPIIYINDAGKMVSIGKERGRTKAIERLLRSVDELGDHVADHRIIIGHTDAPDFAEEIETALRQKYGEKARILNVVVNPTGGAHCGPSGVGIAFHAIHR